MANHSFVKLPLVTYKYPAVIAGESMGVSSPVVCRTPTYYLHFKLEPGAPALEQKIPKGWTTIAYNLEGSVKFGELRR